MYLTSQQVTQLDYAGLKTFLEKGYGEGHHLDYKRAPSGDTPSKKKQEFLKDVAGFANANGGDILIGVDEPADGLSVEEQTVGVEDGESLARALERQVGDSNVIDPRIPGLLVHPVRLPGGRWVVVVHIPPSSGKPHKVDFLKHIHFMQRHSESTVKMTSFDIREAVLASATAEGRAQAYAAKQRERLLETMPLGYPAFVLQATPLVKPESPLDVLSEPVVEVIRGSDRKKRYDGGLFDGFVNTDCHYPILEGVCIRERLAERKARRHEERSTADHDRSVALGRACWLAEFHQNGHVSCAYSLLREPEKADDIGLRFWRVGEEHSKLFHAFADLCDELLASSRFESPFVVACLLTQVGYTRYVTANPFAMRGTEGRAELEWPTALRQPGESFGPIMEDYIRTLRNAYGLE